MEIEIMIMRINIIYFVKLQVKREGEDEPFLNWANPEPTAVSHFGVRTGYGSDGHWNLSQGM